MIDLDDFEGWLRAHNYGEQTIKGSVRAIRRVHGLYLEGIEGSDTSAIRQYLTYCVDTGHTRAAFYRDLALRYSPLEKTPAAKPKGRLREAHSYNDADWAKLEAAVSPSSEPEDEVLHAMMKTALRVGDVLRVDLVTLRAGLKTGVLNLVRKGGRVKPVPLTNPEPWMRIAKGCRNTDDCTNIASYVCPGLPDSSGDGCAYKRVQRRHIRLHETLGLSGRAHTHKLRRTVAIQALKASGNTIAVQQLLGHASHNSTLAYLDEPQIESVAELQRKLNKRTP